jgi:hypothetical protein
MHDQHNIQKTYPVGYVVSNCAVSCCNYLSHLLRLLQTDSTADLNHYELHNESALIASTATISAKKIQNKKFAHTLDNGRTNMDRIIKIFCLLSCTKCISTP